MIEALEDTTNSSFIKNAEMRRQGLNRSMDVRVKQYPSLTQFVETNATLSMSQYQITFCQWSPTATAADNYMIWSVAITSCDGNYR